MRLICGFFHRDGSPASSERLEKMIEAMIEPGLKPRVAKWIDGPMALAVVDFARKTPFEITRCENGMLLAADVRLDEPEKLRRNLQLPREAEHDEILSAFLSRHEKEDLKDVLGDFSLAAWNPHTGTLLCARDGMGIRPFFMAKDTRKTFAFASVPRALHAGDFASRNFDESFLADEIYYGMPGPERSMFEDIARLGPGHLLQVSPEKVHSGRYWQLDRQIAGKRICSPEEASRELSTLLEEAVRCRLPITGPVASHLSGGLDSSAIAILAARILRRENRQLLAYSFVSRTEPAELPYVESVLDQEKDLLWFPVSIDDPESYILPKMDCDQMLPLDPCDPDIRVCSDAANRGANMLLSGWGGDEGATFNGRGMLAEALLCGRWHYLAQEILSLQRTRDWSLFTILKGELLRYLLPHSILNGSKSLLSKRPMIVDSTYGLLRPDFACKANGKRFVEEPSATMNRYRMLIGPHLVKRAEQWALMGSRYGLAVSYPMLDRRVVEFALSLPSHLFLRGGWKRRVYRDAMTGILPEKIRLRHQKLSPFPEIADLMESQRENLLSRMSAFRSHRKVAALFDLDGIENKLRTPQWETDAYALKRILMGMNFILEHSTQDPHL